MAVQHSARVRNAIAVAPTVAIGVTGTPRLQIFTGTQPANCAAAATGTLLSSDLIVSEGYMAAPVNGVATLQTTISGAFTAAGVAGYYRILGGDGSCEEQGTVSLTGGGGDLQLNTASLTVAVGQPFNITARTITAGNP